MAKILFLIGSLEHGGAEKTLIDTADFLISCGHDIHLHALCGNGINEKHLNKQINYRSYVKSSNKLLRRIILKILIWLPPRLSHAILIKEHYDYEVAFLEGLPTKIVSGGNKETIKYAWIHTNLMINKGSFRVYHSVCSAKRAYEIFDKIICVSTEAKNGFISIFNKFTKKNKVDIIRNILNIEKVKKLSLSRPPFQYPANVDVKLLSVGRLSKEKGYERLIQACSELSTRGVQFHLAIAGDGLERYNLENLITQHNLNENITLLGFCDNPYSLMKSADLLICSSYEEGYSTVVTESLIIGTPVLTTDCAGMKEISELSKGIYIVPNSTQGLIDGLINLSSSSNYDYIKKKAERDTINFSKLDNYNSFKKLFSKNTNSKTFLK